MDFSFLNTLVVRSPVNPINVRPLNNAFLESLYLSTPTLHDEYVKHLTNPSKDSKSLKKLDISLYKYQTRSSTRCTPFGLFAGLNIANWGDDNNIIFDENLVNTLKRKTRLDMNVVCSLYIELIKQDFIKPYLRFSPNTSLYLVGNDYRYVEYYYANNRRHHKVNRVESSEYLFDVLNAAKKNLTKLELADILITDEISKEDALYFIDELIDSQLLVNQLEPTVTGNDYFNVLILKLNELFTESQNIDLFNTIELFNSIDFELKKIDKNIFNPIESYKNIHEKLKLILPDLSEINLFQTDLYKKTDQACVNEKTQKALLKTLGFLNKITPFHENSNLEDFKKRFNERYENSEISLLLAVDKETGIGYPSNDTSGLNDLIDDITGNSIRSENDIKWSVLQSCLLKLITDSNKNNKKIIHINEDDFKNIDFSNAIFPASFSVMFKVLNASTNKLEIMNSGGSSAIKLLGRFAGGDDDVKQIVNSISNFEREQLPDCIIAEVVHLPESRVGNILARPEIRAFEIPYLAKSSVGDEYQIKVENLFLKIQGEKIILFDKSLNKEIIPRLGNAHNFSFNSLPLYHFLCDLQLQYYTKPYLGFNWGVLANQFNFLPRVEFENVIISPATWLLNKNDLAFSQDKITSIADKKVSFFELKTKLELPDFFLIVEDDNELLINCKDSISIDTFIDIVKKKDHITLTEYLFEDQSPLIKDSSENSFTNECIAILLNNENNSHKKTAFKFLKPENRQSFSIGSEWLFLKIYCGIKTIDSIISDKLTSITNKLIHDKVIDKWFFIRYADPDIHIRLRLHVIDFSKYGYILELINSTFDYLINDNIVFKLQMDTYKRELERYGHNTITLVEDLFFYDSVFVSNLIENLGIENRELIRWKIAIKSVDAFLNDFGYDLEQKYFLISALNDAFFNEHGGDKNLRITLDNKFRSIRNQIHEVLNDKMDSHLEYYSIIELLNERSKQVRVVSNKLVSFAQNGELQMPLNELIGNLLHMNLIRLFMGRNRTNEFVIYDLLAKTYKSKIAEFKHLNKLKGNSH